MSEPGKNYLRFADGAFLVLEPTTGRYTLETKAGTFLASFDTSGNLRLAGTIASINGVATAGFAGAPVIVSAPATNVGAVAGITNFINFTPPAAAGMYRLSFFVNVTAWTTPASFNVVVAYKDEAGTARSYNSAMANTTTGLQSQAATAVSLYLGTNFAFPIDNSATAITVSTAGTFTGSPVYDFGAVLERLI